MATKESVLANGRDGVPAHVVPTTLGYLIGPEQGGCKEFYVGTVGGYSRKLDHQSVEVTDIRGHEKEFKLDKHGFEYLQCGSTWKDVADDDATKEWLYPEVVDLMKKATGATHVRPISHFVRQDRWDDAQSSWANMKDDEVVRNKLPLRYTHVDHSYTGALEILNDNIEDEEERARLTKTRWAIINVWRPLNNPVTRDALTLCDARSVSESDLEGIVAKLPREPDGTFHTVSNGKEFETWGVRHNPAHRWYYKSGMAPDEAVLLKIFDSKKDGRARRTPHTSFQSPEDSGPPRTSCEVRCFVFWEDQSLE